MAKRSNLGKIKKRSPSWRPFFGNKAHPWSSFLFLISVVVISFLIYRTYSQNVNTFKFSKKPSKPKTVSSAVKHPVHSKSVAVPDHVSYGTPVSPTLPLASELPATQKIWPTSTRPWTNKPKIAFVIDDMGNRRRNEELYRELGSKITYAILPQVPFSTYFSRLSRETGAEVILHQPMESEIGKNPGPGLIKREMSPDEMRSILSANLENVPDHVGINNHMGSLGSADPRLMGVVLKELKRRGMFFLDSHTTPHFVSRKIAKTIDFPVLMRDVFLDNVDQQSYIRGQVDEVRSIARKKGYAIAIGHDRVNTLTVLLEEIPKLEKEGFQIVFPSELIDHGVGLS